MPTRKAQVSKGNNLGKRSSVPPRRPPTRHIPIIPPSGSKIKIEYEQSRPKIIIPQPRAVLRFFFGALCISSFIGWIKGKNFILSLLHSFLQQRESDILSILILSYFFIAFLFYWWLMSGIGGFLLICFLLQPAVQEKIILSQHAMTYDPGVTPIRFTSATLGWLNITTEDDSREELRDYFLGKTRDTRNMFIARKKIEFDRMALKTLALRDLGSFHMLTINHGDDMYELAVGVTYLEREWLFHVLNDYYNS
jgi:hypothetical protein